LATTDAQTGYAPVGDLRMYYEIHGRGRPPFLDAPEVEDS
jgi:hypothetical protein